MPLIKSSCAESAAGSAVVLDFGDLQQQADRIIAEARAEAAEILADARSQEQQMLSTADERGYAAGLERGMKEGRESGEQAGRAEAIAEMKAELETLIERWTNAVDQWDQQRTVMIEQSREDVLELALLAASKIVGRVIEIDASVIETQLAETLALVSRASCATVHLNPEDRDLASSVLGGLMDRLSMSGEVVVKEDASITRGGCRVTSSHGGVDATIERQLARMTEVLWPAGGASTKKQQHDGA